MPLIKCTKCGALFPQNTPNAKCSLCGGDLSGIVNAKKSSGNSPRLQQAPVSKFRSEMSASDYKNTSSLLGMRQRLGDSAFATVKSATSEQNPAAAHQRQPLPPMPEQKQSPQQRQQPPAQAQQQNQPQQRPQKAVQQVQPQRQQVQPQQRPQNAAPQSMPPVPPPRQDRNRQPTHQTPKPLKNSVIVQNRYEIIRPIKRGGMGAIYEVQDRRLRKRWALKEMIENFDNEQESREANERFEREATLLASLNHPNLPRVIDFFEENERFYLVMDYVPGVDLNDLLKQRKDRKLPLEQVLSVSQDVLDILDYLHHRTPPIIYRDIKPGNIMIRNEDSKTFLVDFGIARSISPESTDPKTEVGTVGYAPPEQYTGNPIPSSDLYALGATMHELISGIAPKIPFQFAPLKEVIPDLPDDLNYIITKSLELDYHKRWQNAGEMLTALKLAVRKLKSASSDFADMPTQMQQAAGISFEQSAIQQTAVQQKQEQTAGSVVEIQQRPQQRQTENSQSIKDIPQKQQIPGVVEIQQRPQKQAESPTPFKDMPQKQQIPGVVELHPRQQFAPIDLKRRPSKQPSAPIEIPNRTQREQEAQQKQLAQQISLKDYLQNLQNRPENPESGNSEADRQLQGAFSSAPRNAFGEGEPSREQSVFIEEDEMSEYASLFSDPYIKTDHRYRISNVTFHPVREEICFLDSSGSLLLKDLNTYKEVSNIYTGYKGISTISFTGGGEIIAYNSNVSACDIVESQNLRTAGQFSADAGRLVKVICHPAKPIVLAGFEDGTIIKYNFYNDTLSTFKYSKTQLTAMSLSNDCQTLFTGHSNGIIYAWHIDSENIQAKFTEHKAAINDISISPGNKIAASCSADGTVILRKLPDLTPVGQLTDPQSGAFHEAVYSPNRFYIITTSQDQRIRLWDPVNKRNRIIYESDKRINKITVKNYGRSTYLAAAAENKIIIWKNI